MVMFWSCWLVCNQQICMKLSPAVPFLGIAYNHIIYRANNLDPTKFGVDLDDDH